MLVSIKAAGPIKPAPPVTNSFMVGSFTDKDKLATDGTDFHGRKDENKIFCPCGSVWVCVGPCESVAMSELFGEFVEVNHFIGRIIDDVADDCGAYKTSSACDEKFHAGRFHS